MADKGFAERHVFISHVTDDPHWPSDAIEAVASTIRDSGFSVRLDLWKQSTEERFQSLDSWRVWVDDAVIGASHIICLVSPRYRKQWQRRFEDSKNSLALSAISLISNESHHGQKHYGRIVCMRPKGCGSECVPAEIVGNLSYKWSADRHKLFYWLLERHSFLLEGGADHLDVPVAPSTQQSDGLILHGLHYPSTVEPDDSDVSVQLSDLFAVADGAMPAADNVADIEGLAVVLDANGISTLDAALPPIEVQKNETATAKSSRVIPPSLGNRDMWPAEDAWRAPIGDFPPPWASAWGDDPYGLWADLTVNGVTQRMRWIEPSGPEGFWMGSTKQERAMIKNQEVRQWANQHEHEPRKECIKVGFWLADTPCTQGFWTAVVGTNPSHFSDRQDAAERPVENLSWDAVMDRFVSRFAQSPDWGTEDRLCLPSDLEWEYVARAGTRMAYWWGDAPGDMRANWNRLREATTPVKDYAPNPWGLYDVHGNVWEWCSDVWRPSRDAPEARPDEAFRVLRGGSWITPPSHARAAFRFRGRSGDAYRHQGFRFALRSPG